MLRLPVHRKRELMLRDPFVIQYLDTSFQCFEEPLNRALIEKWYQLTKEVEEKWSANIYFPESTKQGVTDWFRVESKPYKAVVDARWGATYILKSGEKGFESIMASFQDNSLIYCEPHKIPIIIDPTILTLRDEKKVKDAVWDIVTPEIGKHKKTIRGRDFAVPPKEPEELAAVLRCKSETFEKYLRWYDLKMEGGRGLSFTLIALIEFHSKPGDREQKFEDQIHRRKKPKIGKRVKGESTIREGFNIIFRAIFRTPAPVQEDDIPTLETYNCPDHGDSCNDPDCAYLKCWLADFDIKNKMPYSKEQPTDPKILDLRPSSSEPFE
jgi:hypothetical protein